MPTSAATGPLPEWAPKVAHQPIQRLYQSDARGLLDEELLSDVGYTLGDASTPELQATYVTWHEHAQRIQQHRQMPRAQRAYIRSSKDEEAP